MNKISNAELKDIRHVAGLHHKLVSTETSASPQKSAYELKINNLLEYYAIFDYELLGNYCKSSQRVDACS